MHIFPIKANAAFLTLPSSPNVTPPPVVAGQGKQVTYEGEVQPAEASAAEQG